MFSPMINEWKNTKTFATQANLEKYLVKCGLHELTMAAVVRTPEGRWTAIFAKSAHENFMYICHKGFKVFG